MQHRSADRPTDQSLTRPSSRAAGTTLLKSKSQQNIERKQAFLEDFNGEHCGSTVTVSLVAFSANGDAQEPGANRTPYAYQFNAPSCVYLG